MDERERRDFDAGLREEVDSWLRGDTSRRTFLTRLVLMGGAAMVPGFGFTAPARVPGRTRSMSRRSISPIRARRSARRRRRR